MTAPRLVIDLRKIHHNARTLVERLATRGISVTGVVKAALGSPALAGALVRAGVRGLGDARVENLERLQREAVPASRTLLRSPMMSQADRVVRCADVSFNTERTVMGELSRAALEADRMHGVVLMVELGDLREGILPGDLEQTVRETLRLPGIVFRGLGANLACLNGISPDRRNMAQLSSLTDSIESTFGLAVDVVSGGSSASLVWALGDGDTGRINDLRLGESLLLGREPLHRRRIEGLFTDAITLVAEVIESKVKPSLPWGEAAQSAFGEPPLATDHGDHSRAILAIGRQDTDPGGLEPPDGITVLGASSDHLVVDAGRCPLPTGREVAFQLNYSALLRAMTSPFVEQVLQGEPARVPVAGHPLRS